MSTKILVKYFLGMILTKSNRVNNIVLSAMLSMSSALIRLKNRGTDVRTIIDVGGSDGRWSIMAMRHYPKASYFIIEANKIHEKSLKRAKDRLSNLDYIIAAAGDRIGELYFDARDPFGGLASHTKTEKCTTVIPATTIDYQISENNLESPFMIKLDTHGFEVPILEGTKDALKETEVVVIETYNFGNRLRFHEMCSYMEEHNFRCIDIAEPMYRPLDKSFWQIDLIFVQAKRPEFKLTSYK